MSAKKKTESGEQLDLIDTADPAHKVLKRKLNRMMKLRAEYAAASKTYKDAKQAVADEMHELKLKEFRTPDYHVSLLDKSALRVEALREDVTADDNDATE